MHTVAAMLTAIGLVALCLGVVAVAIGILQKMKAARVADAPLARTGDVAQRGHQVAGPKGQISAQGAVVCHQPLIAPFSGQPCLFYSIKCTAKWKDGENHKSKVIDEQKYGAQFGIDDGSGPVWIDAHEGGDFEPSQRKTETRGTGLLGGLTGTELVFGQYRVATPMLDVGTSYEVTEEILPVVSRMYACGRVGDQMGVIASPSWRQLILSSKSRDELLASATKTAKLALAAGAFLFLSGASTSAIGTFVLHEGEEAKAPPSAVAKNDQKPTSPATTAMTNALTNKIAITTTTPAAAAAQPPPLVPTVIAASSPATPPTKSAKAGKKATKAVPKKKS